MQTKSTRGVQQDDVWAAADALIAEGLRPTIERVRQKLGRGSPNTVSPMLEAWFATLGPRLGVSEAKKDMPELPAAVQSSAAKLWEMALSQARQDAESSLVKDRETLAVDRAAVELRASALTQQEAVLVERLAAADRAHEVSQKQISALENQLRHLQTVLAERDDKIAEVQTRLSSVEQQREAERQGFDEKTKHHAVERLRSDERALANERRLMADIDRERQELKRAKAQATELQQRALDATNALETRTNELTQRLRHTDEELRVAHQALAAANERAEELRALLNAQADTNADVLKQLQAMMAAQTRPPAVTQFKRRNKSKTKDQINSNKTSS